jgi:hypothetical protein
MAELVALSEGQEPEANEAGAGKYQAHEALSDDNVHGPQDAMQHILPELHPLRDVSESGSAGLLPLQTREIRVEEQPPTLAEPGREFMIGRKIFTLQRSLCDNTWDVEIPGEGWISTGFPKSYTAGMAEARFRNDFKGGKRWVSRRIQDSGRG